MKFDSTWFNILVIWIFTFLLLVALYFNILSRVLNYFESWKLNRQAELRDRIFYNPMAFIKPARKKEK